MFECVNQAAVHEELEDETRRLCDVRPFLPVLKLITRNCGRAERILDSKIGVLIGKGDIYVHNHMHNESYAVSLILSIGYQLSGIFQ